MRTAEALEQQTATSEMLRVIASSPTDVQPVFEAIVRECRSVVRSDDSALFRFEGERSRLTRAVGPNPAVPLTRRGSSPMGRAIA